jgi:amidase
MRLDCHLTTAALLAALTCPPQVAAQQRAGANPARGAIPSGAYAVGIVSLGDTMWVPWTLRITGDSVNGDMSPRAPNSLRGVLRRDSIDMVQMWDSVTVRARFRTSFADTATWIGVPIAVRQGPPRSLTFEPTTFHRTFSAAASPAMRIFPGDTVQTRTIDAGGTDWNGVRRWAGGNPQTGPFYVEGVMPGDVVAIHLHRVRLNRDDANAGTFIVPTALTPDALRSLSSEERSDGRWLLDRARGVARLANPPASLARYEVPLQPQVGTIAVAPARSEAFRTQDSGDFGGNMDYNALREGTTVYLTANVPGALVFLGDGHAVQGDGELTGDALETSMDVSFSVDIVRGMPPGSPRAESEEFLMAIGIAGDLDTAFRKATSELNAWLMQRYRLSAGAAAAVLGTAIRYDVADVVGAQVSVVAKVAKSRLPAGQ